MITVSNTERYYSSVQVPSRSQRRDLEIAPRRPNVDMFGWLVTWPSRSGLSERSACVYIEMSCRQESLCETTHRQAESVHENWSYAEYSLWSPFLVELRLLSFASVLSSYFSCDFDIGDWLWMFVTVVLLYVYITGLILGDLRNFHKFPTVVSNGGLTNQTAQYILYLKQSYQASINALCNF